MYMQIVKQADISIPDIVLALKAGKTLVYPTETCYGLGCDATNQVAIEHIFEIKHRQRNKPMLVVAADISLMMEYVVWDETLQKIADRYWPGPVTVVVQAQGRLLPLGVVGEDGTLAFRITKHPLAAELSRSLDAPIVSTSANIASLESPYDISSIVSMYGGAEMQPDIIIDAGELPYESPSTVVRVKDGRMRVLRQGEIVVKL
ncbi:MAG TPA: threonylcarbamoyl-AMP synthase [Candidatus Magasanikbacteria bacterium]|nr:MAG: threonylcarbamoyl-AMP synthase [Candidatus Magasanikbacteria bacterium RIFOXYC2_FULL_39_8]HAT03665.1 threonylcarbamoyl-AMP synthase [Candidatus Magasanikbacteria bacterium]